MTYSFVDCSTSILEEYDCKSKTYENTNLADFVLHCAPIAWLGFFGREAVVKAIQLADTIRKQLHEEVSKLKAEKNTVSDYYIEPPITHMLEAFKTVNPDDIKVVILGQDPTPQKGKAQGRAFSVKDPRTVPAVMNVLLEVALEGWSVDLDNGDLKKWEDQGVMLLNSALTIAKIEYRDIENNYKTQELSHLGPWCPFTKLLISYISQFSKPSVWMLWGKVAQDFTVDRKYDKSNYDGCFNHNKAINTDQEKAPSLIKNGYVLRGAHPASVGSGKVKNQFFAGNYFHCANVYLLKYYKKRVNWGLRDGDVERHNVNNKVNECP